MRDAINKIKYIFKETKLLNVIMALIAYFSLTTMKVLPAYNMASWLVMICLIMVFLKVNIYDKAFNRSSIIFAFLFSLFNTVGCAVQHIMNSSSLSLFKVLLRPNYILYFIGMFCFFYVILKLFFPKIFNFKLGEEACVIRNRKKVFLLSLGFLLLCWLPYYLAFFPGILSYDSIEQLGIIINGFQNVSDHHPLIHTIFISIFYNIGFYLTHNVNLAVALFTFVQMLVMASIFSYLLTFLYERKVNFKVLVLVFLFYAILPIYGFYSITMWKDVIFGGLVLLLILEIVKLLENDNKNVSFKKYIPFTIVSLLCVFFRNNGIYMYLLVILFGLKFIKNKMKLGITFLIIISVFFIIKGPIFSYFSVSKSESVEYIAMPIQQIGRMAFKNVNFNSKETELLNTLMPVDKMALAYDPKKSDGIKFSEYFNQDVFNQNKTGYFNLWISLVIKHPDVALESYLVSTLGYWYPTPLHWSIFNYTYKNDYGFKTESVIPNLKPLLSSLTSKKVPVLNLEWSIALTFWILLLFGFVTVYKKGWKYLYPYIPVFGIWLTMMIASPVFAELRYVYGAITSLPILVLFPYLSIKQK